MAAKLIGDDTAGSSSRRPQEPLLGQYAIAIHGGAGTIRRDLMTPALVDSYLAALRNATGLGEDILERGGTATEAVLAAVASMEASELFNAGRGSVLTQDGTVEMDASLMDGRTGEGGAVAGVTATRSPI
eukprot:g2684.t1